MGMNIDFDALKQSTIDTVLNQAPPSDKPEIERLYIQLVKTSATVTATMLKQYHAALLQADLPAHPQS